MKPLYVLLLTAALARGACSEAQGQAYIDSGDYAKAVKEFSCLIDRNPAGFAGYRGRIEANLLLDRYADAMRDHARLAAPQEFLDHYAARLAAAPANIPALTGASFARWWYFQYAQSIQLLNDLLAAAPSNLYGNVLRGSARVLSGAKAHEGVADLERAILLAPANPHVHFLVADAYTYGIPDPSRAFAEATLALNGGLDIPRVRAILGACYLAWGNMPLAAAEIAAHIAQVTVELVPAAAPAPGAAVTLPLTRGRVYELAVPLAAGERLELATSSKDLFDTILVLLAPGGAPVYASDDAVKYFAAVDFTAPAAGVYRVRVTSFEAAGEGNLTVKRQ